MSSEDKAKKYETVKYLKENFHWFAEHKIDLGQLRELIELVDLQKSENFYLYLKNEELLHENLDLKTENIMLLKMLSKEN